MVVTVWAIGITYLILEELNIVNLLELSLHLLTALTASLATTTALITGILPSLRIANSLAKRWKTKEGYLAQ